MGQERSLFDAWCRKFRLTTKEIAAVLDVGHATVTAWRMQRYRPDDFAKIKIAAWSRGVERDFGVANPRGFTILDWFADLPGYEHALAVAA